MFLEIFGAITFLLQKFNILSFFVTRSSADADNRRDAFSGQSRSTNMVPFWVRCDFSLSMSSPPRVIRVYATDTSLSF